MITKEQIAAQMMKECDIAVHLHTKLDPKSADYRPTPGQRSTLELLRYLAISGIAGTRCMAESDWKVFSTFSDRVKAMKFEEFPAAMQRQRQEIETFFNEISETSLETQDAPLPAGGTAKLGVAILGGPFKWITAYKLQLFLYAKATGASDIGTANAWAGIDWKKP